MSTPEVRHEGGATSELATPAMRLQILSTAPDLRPLFVMGMTDDREGISRTMGLLPWRSTAVNLLAATPVLVGVLNGILFAAIVALLGIQLGASSVVVVVIGAVGFALSLLVLAAYSRRGIAATIANHRPMFPTPLEEPPAG